MSEPATTEDRTQLPYAVPDGDDEEMQALIESWRYRGRQVAWDDVVGHAPQVARCRELAEKLRRTPEELARLRIRIGAGILICGDAGVGKTLLARAIAAALERDAIVPPTPELGPETIRRLYAQLSKREPSVVILDEAEVIIGLRFAHDADPGSRRAFLAALDGVERPDRGPITVALTTASWETLDSPAVRPGRLAPRLVLERPTAADREVILLRAMDGLPISGSLDVQRIVERTQGWTGAELVVAIEDACARSLVDHSDALREDLLLDVVAERYVITDESLAEEDDDTLWRMAVHEAGHAFYAFLAWPGAIRQVQLQPRHGTTSLSESVERQLPDARLLRRFTEMALAGAAGEAACWSQDRLSSGSRRDKARATQFLHDLLLIAKPYDPDVLESGDSSDRGSERMRAGLHAELEQLAEDCYRSALRLLAPHSAALLRFAQRLVDAPDYTLSGGELEHTLAECLRLVADADADVRSDPETGSWRATPE